MLDCNLYPTFLGIGAARSGTTSLYQWLYQHPGIYMSPVKEPNFFSGLSPTFCGPGDEQNLNRPLEKDFKGNYVKRHAAIVTSLEDYCDLFLCAEGYSIRGEISPSYLYYPDAAGRIHKLLPQSKIMIFLRDPIERAFSQYKLFVMVARETKEFDEAIHLEESRIKDGWEYAWSYRGLGLYAKQVKHYLNLFPRKQVGVWLYEELRQSPTKIYTQVCDFIGADVSFIPDFSHHNPSQNKVTKLQWFYNRYVYIISKFTKHLPISLRSHLGLWIEQALGTKQLILSNQLRSELLDYYRRDILELDKLLPELGVLRWIDYQERKLINVN